MVETLVISNIAQIFDVGIYHGFSDNNAECAVRNNHNTFISPASVILHPIVASYVLD